MILCLQAGGDTHMEPTKPNICGNGPSSTRKVAMELNQPPPLTRDVTSRVTDTPPIHISHHLESQGQKERAGDQSIGLTNSTEHPKPDLESTQLGHVSNSLQDGQVTTAMNSSTEEDTLPKMSEKDHTDGNLMIKGAFDKPKGKMKSVATSLNRTEINDMGINVDKKKDCVGANVQGQKSTSKEKSTVGSKQSVSLVTEFVQIRNMSDVEQSQTTNDSSNTKAPIKHTKALKFQRNSHGAMDNVSKMDIQEEGQSYTAKNENQQSSTSKTTTIANGKNDNDHVAAPTNSLTFLSQHPKNSHFTIPAIYVTDVDSTSPNTNTQNMERSSPTKSENVEFSAKTNAKNNNTVSQKANTFEHTDKDETTGTLKSEVLSDAQTDLPVHPQPSAVNQPQQTPQGHENFSQSESISSDFTGPIGRCMQPSNADKSKKANESDLAETKCPALLAKTDSNLKTQSDSFIKQLKSAALDLEMSNQRSSSVTLHDTSHPDSEGKDKYRQTNSEVKQEESVLLQSNTNLHTVVGPSSDVTIPLETTDAQIFTAKPTAPPCEPIKTEKVHGVKENQNDMTQPLMQQAASPSSSDKNSMSLQKHSPSLTRRGVTADLSKLKGNENAKTKSSDRDKENQFKGKNSKYFTVTFIMSLLKKQHMLG